MDTLRTVQFLTDLAYLLLGVAAVGAAIRSHERARLDVALLFGSLAVVVVLQEIPLLSCATSLGCISLPFAAVLLAVVAVLVLPWALLRLIDDVADVPRWQMWLALVLLVAISVCFVLAGPEPPGWLVALLLAYLTLGTLYAAWQFIHRAARATGMTRRRMVAVAWGCGLLAISLILSSLSPAVPRGEALGALSRVASLVSGLCFWAGFFPPGWLSQAWRLPELLEYLRPAHLMAVPAGEGFGSEAVAVERLIAATDRTTGARRTFLMLEDPARHDLYLWGSPSARVQAEHGLVGQVLASGRPLVDRLLVPERLPPSIVAVFASETLPRTGMLVPVTLDGRPVGVLAAFADKGPMFVEDDLNVLQFFAGEAAAVLRMQRLRETAAELEALREADRLKDEFMAVVSHELRTPLTAISGYSDILLRRMAGPLNERQERQVVGIRDAARRLLALINDLLDVSKLEAGTLDLRLAPLDAHAALRRAAASTQVIAASKGVRLEVGDPTARLPPVRADDERLQQMLTNLLVNAIKFTPQGGRVWATVSAELSPTGGGQEEIVFAVHDTGLGLAPGQAERIWDRFYQAEPPSTRRFGGAGLGLSIVRRLAELHGGRAEASSAGLNRGSTFRVRLPAAHEGTPPALEATTVSTTPPAMLSPQTSQTTAPTVAGATAPTVAGATAPTVAGGSELVLVVEDDPHIATVLRTYLEADAYAVQVVTDGQQAIQAARSLRPFAITLDISLPKLDGWSVLNALKREPTTADIPVVIVSIVDNRDFGLVLGATDYLLKPIDPERLRTVLRGMGQARETRGGGSILIVDDDPALRDVLGSILSDDGWRVATAVDGEAALTALEHERPAAMVLDLMMPRVDGFEVLNSVRQQPSLHDLPVVVLTARELTDEDRRRLSTSVHRVLLKDQLGADQLRQEIRGLLRQHRARVGDRA